MTLFRPDKIKVKKHSNSDYVFEFYNKNNTCLHENRSAIISVIREVTRDGWGEPGELVLKWFELIDILIFAKENDIIKGFVIAKFLSDDVISIVATVVSKEKQATGLGSLLNTLVLLELSFSRIKRNYLKLFSPISFVFRTPNPKLFSIALRNLNIYPDLKGHPPNEKQVNIFNDFIKTMSPDSIVDQSNFVTMHSLKRYPDLIYSLETIPWSDNSKVNNFFIDKVRLLEREGNTLVVVGRISIKDAVCNLKKILWI